MLFSALALASHTYQQAQTVGMEPVISLPSYGFSGVLALLGFAKLSGSRILFRMAFFIIGISLIAFGGMVAYQWSIPGVMRVLETEKWRETPCVILKSEIVHEKRSDGKIRLPNIRYAYEVNGCRYESDVVDVFWTPINGGMNAQGLINDHPVEMETVCRVNPNNPREATLQGGWRPMHYVAFLPLLLFLPGIVMLIAAFWKKRE